MLTKRWCGHKGVTILQYTDDTIICLKDDVDMSRNMKLLLYLYELMSGLKINFGKSEIIMIHGDDIKHNLYANIFNCQLGTFPIKYLGVSVSPSRLHVKDWAILENKNAKKLSSWKGNSLSIAGRIVLINSSLSSAFITICRCTSYQKQHHRLLSNKEENSFGKVTAPERNIV